MAVPPLGGSNGAGAGEFRLGTGVLYAVCGVKPMVGAGRDLRGRYTRGQADLFQINWTLAHQLQALVAEELDVGRVPNRRGVASGRLRNAILDDRNRVVRKEGFGVGVMNYLDRSDAKYWRQIERGSTIHVGRELPVGVWGSSLTGGVGGRSRYGPYPLAGPEWSPTGARRDGRVRPMGRTYAYRALVSSGMRKRDAYLAANTRAIIREPIDPQYYFARAWRAFNPRARAQRALREVFGISGTPRQR
jgi:hypothetical protein